MVVSSSAVNKHSSIGVLRNSSARSARPAATPIPLSAPKVVPLATCTMGHTVWRCMECN